MIASIALSDQRNLAITASIARPIILPIGALIAVVAVRLTARKCVTVWPTSWTKLVDFPSGRSR
jgi:hypothetical protein